MVTVSPSEKGNEQKGVIKVHFFLSMNPPTKTQQEHRIGKRKDGSIYFYEDRDLKEARQKLRKALSKIERTCIKDKPIRLMVKWLFPKGKHRNGEYKITKPDTDNLNKMLKDEMTRLKFWEDDALVVSEIIEKFWADTPGIFINVEEIDDGTEENS